MMTCFYENYIMCNWVVYKNFYLSVIIILK